MSLGHKEKPKQKSHKEEMKHKSHKDNKLKHKSGTVIIMIAAQSAQTHSARFEAIVAPDSYSTTALQFHIQNIT